MENLHNVVKYFSSASVNRKTSVLEEHRHVTINQLNKDHNGTMIVAMCRLLKSALKR